MVRKYEGKDLGIALVKGRYNEKMMVAIDR